MNLLVARACERCMAQPNRREMIFSRSFQRSQALFQEVCPVGSRKRYETRDLLFSNGSSLHFGYIQHESDIHHYAGCEAHQIEFDSTFSPYIQDWMLSRERP